MSTHTTPRPARARGQKALLLALLIVLAATMSLPGAGSPALAAGNDDAAPALAAAGDAGTAASLQATPEPTRDRSRYRRGESNVTFRWEVLIDTLALLVARGWVCCGGLAVAGIAAAFVVLWVKSQRRPRP